MTSRKTSQLNEKRTKHSGFTLIELIMVIVILGILSAFALPKFADFAGDARTSTIEGARGAVRSGSAIAHAQFLANGSTGATVTLEGVDITITEGYPDQDDLVDLADLDGYTVNTDSAATIISIDGTDNSLCFSYTNATAIAAPIIGANSTLTNGGTDAADTCP